VQWALLLFHYWYWLTILMDEKEVSMSDRGLNKAYLKKCCERYEDMERDLYLLIHRLRTYWDEGDLEATRDQRLREDMSVELHAYKRIAETLQAILEKDRE
jgi:hypothetical protein